MLDDLLRLRPRKQLRDRFGDVDPARDVLRALTALLDELDDPAFEEPGEGRAGEGEPAKKSVLSGPMVRPPS